MYTALQAANWLSEYSDQDYKPDPNIDRITPMCAQKLLYYAQCASLALNDKPLFPDSIYKMPSSPEIESVAVFCGRRHEIPKSLATLSNFELINKDAETRNLLENIYRIYDHQQNAL